MFTNNKFKKLFRNTYLRRSFLNPNIWVLQGRQHNVTLTKALIEASKHSCKNPRKTTKIFYIIDDGIVYRFSDYGKIEKYYINPILSDESMFEVIVSAISQKSFSLNPEYFAHYMTPV